MCLSLYQQRLPIPNHLKGAPPKEVNEKKLWDYERICTGLDGFGERPIDEIIRNWRSYVFADLDINCPQLFDLIIHTRPDTNLYLYNPDGHARIKETMSYLLSRYFNSSDGSNLVLPGNRTWNQFQNTLIKTCLDVPGVCDDAQKYLCGGCSRAQISNNPDLLTLCGCYAEPLDPAIYKNKENIKTECDPLCSRIDTAKLMDPETGDVFECNDSVCVLDNISITATKSSTTGVSISQICPGCSDETGCKCIVDVSIVNMASSIGLDDPFFFQQYCPPENSTCINIDRNTNSSEIVPCADYFTVSLESQYKTNIPTIIIIIVAIIVVLVIFSLIIYISGYNKYYKAIEKVNNIKYLVV